MLSQKESVPALGKPHGAAPDHPVCNLHSGHSNAYTVLKFPETVMGLHGKVLVAGRLYGWREEPTPEQVCW